MTNASASSPPTWLVPFVGRNATGPTGLNFLWKAGNVYVMDNHRAAGWCWAQEVAQGVDHGVYHIDRHTDALESDLHHCLARIANGINMGINQYLDLTYPPAPGSGSTLPIKVFRWDNYLPIHLSLNGPAVSPLIFATHRDGDFPKHHPYAEVEPWDLINFIDYDIRQHDKPWIVNVDIDYFFCTQDDDCVRFLHDDYVDRLAAVIAQLNADGKLAVVTIALTATDGLTDGWTQAEAIAERMCAAMGLTFKLP